MLLFAFPLRLASVLSRMRQPFLPGLLGVVVLLLAAGPAQAQDVVVNDAADGFAPCNGGEDEISIQAGVNTASPGETVFVCPGTYAETVTVDKSVTLRGNNADTPGYNARSAETTIDAGTASLTSAAFTIQADDVTINGFRLVGSQGIELNGASAGSRNAWVGARFENNLVETNIRGVRIQNFETSASSSFTIRNNQFAIQQQLFDGPDSDTTPGSTTGEETSSIELRTISGPSDGDRPTIQENVITTDGDDDSGGGTNDGSFYGYEIDGVKIESGPVTIAGDPNDTGSTGTIQGTAQGISVLDGQTGVQSNVVIEDFSVSMMSGSSPDNDPVNFHAGVYTYVDGNTNSGTTTIVLRDLTIEGLDFSDTNDDFSANINVSHFGQTGNATQNVVIAGATVQNTEHRGIYIGGGAAPDINLTITDDADGDNTTVSGMSAGNDAHLFHSESGGSVTLNNTTLTNEDILEAEAVHLRDFGPVVTVGPDVTINSNGRLTFGDLSTRPTAAELKVTSPTTLSTLHVGLWEDPTFPGSIALTGTETLRVTDRLVVSGGDLDVSNGTLTLASTGPASTAVFSNNGNGSLTGEVTVEWQVPSGYTGFQALTAPVNAPLDGTSNALLSNMWTQKSGSGTGYDAANGGVTGSSVFDYDETAAVGGSTTEDLNNAWVAPSDISMAITPGQTGRLVYFFNDRDFDGTDDAGSAFTLSATGTLLPEENTNTDVDLGLTYTENDGGGDADGWNLVGNPFMAPIDWELMTGNGAGRTKTSRTVYIPKAGGTYATYQADKNGLTNGMSTNGGSRYLSPFQAFFVKATGTSPSLTVTSDDKAVSETPTLKRNGPSTPTVKLRMRADGSSRTEETAVRFSDRATRDASDGDAYQLVPLSGDYFYVASEIPDSSSAYEIQSLPLPDTGTRTVPLELASATTRTYTLDGTLGGVPSGWTVRLKDRQTGATADLTRGESLTVELAGTDKSTADAASKTASSRPRLRQPLVASASGTAPGAPNKAAADSARVVLEAARSGTLPVELAEFEGQSREGTVELAWTTASESNNAGFRIQRSPSGSAPWTPLGFIEGEGTTSSPQTYRFTDDDLPYEGDTFTYRLKQVDTDGAVQYSDPVTVGRAAPSALRIRSTFPNPARSQVTVRYEVPDATKVTLALYDVLGRRVATVLNRPQEPGRKKVTVPVSGLSSGVHFLRLRTESTVKTRKLVVVE